MENKKMNWAEVEKKITQKKQKNYKIILVAL